MANVMLGAPSLTGRGCDSLVREAFSNATYPLSLKVTNYMPRAAVFAEVDGLVLGHVADLDNNAVTVTVTNFDQLVRLASSVEQISELNAYAESISLDDGAQAVTATDEAPAPTKKSKSQAQASA